VPSGTKIPGRFGAFFIAFYLTGGCHACFRLALALVSVLPLVFLVFVLVAVAWGTVIVFGVAWIRRKKILAYFLALAWPVVGNSTVGLVFYPRSSHLAAAVVVTNLERPSGGGQSAALALASLGLVCVALAPSALAAGVGDFVVVEPLLAWGCLSAILGKTLSNHLVRRIFLATSSRKRPRPRRLETPLANAHAHNTATDSFCPRKTA
jgi:hypothetical protein